MLRPIFKLLPYFIVEWLAFRMCERMPVGNWHGQHVFNKTLIVKVK